MNLLATRHRAALSAAVGCIVVVMGLLPAGAAAHESHAFSKTFGAATSTPANPYPLSNPTDVAVDQSNGDVYVSDPLNHRIEKFTSSGEFLFMFGKEVNRTAINESRPEGEQDICPASGHPTDVCQPGIAGTLPGAFKGSYEQYKGQGIQYNLFLAVDNSPAGEGDVYVGDPGIASRLEGVPGGEAVSKFTPSGHLIGSWAEHGQLRSPGLGGIAVDQSGHLFAILESEGGHFPLYEFNQNASPLTYFEWNYTNHSGADGHGIALDTEGNIYYHGGSSTKNVIKSTPEEVDPYIPGTVDVVFSAGLAGDPGTGDLYVSQGEAGFVREYAAPICNPNPTCTPTDYFGDGHLSGAVGIAIDAESRQVYVANSAEGTVAVFHPITVPLATTGEATSIERNSAELHAEVNPSGFQLKECVFEYVTATAFAENEAAHAGREEKGFADLSSGGTVPCTEPDAAEVPVDSSAHPLHAEIKGLIPETAYRFRLSAAGGEGADEGIAQPFETKPSVAGVHTEPPTGVQRTSATLAGSFTGNGEDTRYHFEYVTDAQFEAHNLGEEEHRFREATSTETKDAGSVTGTQKPTFKLEGIAPATGYHYRFVAENPDGATVAHDEQTFTTPPAVADVTTEPATHVERNSATLVGSFTGSGDATEYHFQYVTQAQFEKDGFASATASEVKDAGSPPKGETVTESFTQGELTAQTTYHYRFIAHNLAGTTVAPNEQTFETPPAVTQLQTEPASEIKNVSALLNASFSGEGLDTHYYFEYGTTTAYGHLAPVPPGTDTGAGTRDVATPIEKLAPGTTYHFRAVAVNEFGSTKGQDREFTTYQPPTIEGFSTSHLTATSADLEARVNPEGEPAGVEAECHFEYGPTTAYGTAVPCPQKLSGTAGQSVVVPIEGLSPGVTYHFRFTARNVWGTVTSEDQSFEFFPPACPNAAVRQQTSSAYLPDCRAYELVSPANANGTIFYPGGPTSPYATSPSRFAYVGAFATAVPGAPTINTNGDVYLATRTDTGWVSHYIGLPSNEAGCVAGPPNDPWSNHGSIFEFPQNKLPTDPSMSRVVDFLNGAPLDCTSEGYGTTEGDIPFTAGSNAPYLWSAEGSRLGRLPTDLQSVPGAAAALECPGGGTPGLHCYSDVAFSGDLTHFAFSSNSVDFAEGTQAGEGLTQAPGSAYDDNLSTGKVTLISRLPGGKDIPQDPAYAAHPPATCGIEGKENEPRCPDEEFIRFPAVSADGSRVLISTASTGTPPCGYPPQGCARYTDYPLHLYLSVNDAVTYPIAENPTTHEAAAVHYVGTAAEGSKVFFTSEEHLTGEDEQHEGTSLYMWSENGGNPTLTLISKANPGSPAGAGNTGSCSPASWEPWTGRPRFSDPVPTGPWTQKCDVVPYSNWVYEQAISGHGGNGHSDAAIASQSGDVYFFSPEQLAGDRGVPGQENLYDYRAAEGRLQFVASFAPANSCAIKSAGLEDTGLYCSEGPVVRMQVTPDGAHMAFVTPDRITSYDNTVAQGSCQTNVSGEPTGETHCTEMYTYDPATGKLVCASCNPSGQRPTSDVYASENGLFLTDDGRSFFSTEEALVPADTDKGTDVYEYVDGRPQLISSGTGFPGITKSGQFHENSGEGFASNNVPGLIGVSANGTDVYFSTFDTLTSEDHNGQFLKFYDARTNGGFPQPPPAQPCAAAEECHGPGTEAPALPTQGTAATLAGGNATPGSHKHKKKHHRKNRRHHKRAAHNRRAAR